mmetsp:Transcript_20113/g.51198  ORF Transcript_20113/g.51198 Transcript_20113/m.51198 type:complete len:558 (-) Transcript_20113:735-2408(-)
MDNDATDTGLVEAFVLPDSSLTSAEALTDAPEVLAQVVDDRMTADGKAIANEGVAHMSENGGYKNAYVPPQPPMLHVTSDGDDGVHVRLTLSVNALGSQIAPGLQIEDCGKCTFCLDKPKYGGPGTKRQKCELKQNEAGHSAGVTPGAHVWTCLHLVKESEYAKIQAIEAMPLPDILQKAADAAPLPVVWAYRRKRRARTLPPAYVLMYFCEGRVPLDRSELAASRQRFFKNSRIDGAAPTSTKQKAPRRPRVPRNAPPRHSEHRAEMDHPIEMQFGAQHLGATHPQVMVDNMPHSSCSWQPVSSMANHGCTFADPMHMSPAAGYNTPYSLHVPPNPYPPHPAYPPQAMPLPIMYPPPPPGPPQSMQPINTMAPFVGTSSLLDERHMQRHVIESGIPHHPDYLAHEHPHEPNYYMDMEHLPMHHHVPMPMGPVSTEQMEAEANSWLAIDQPQPPLQQDPPLHSARQRKKRANRPTAGEGPDRDVGDSARGDGDGEAASMSNKTLDIMLQRLQGQLPKDTYEQVITLVRDVQMRKLSLSRSEFLQHFQAICAGSSRAP